VECFHIGESLDWPFEKSSPAELNIFTAAGNPETTTKPLPSKESSANQSLHPPFPHSFPAADLF
jgi:hypothetical protein